MNGTCLDPVARAQRRRAHLLDAMAGATADSPMCAER